MQKFIRIRGARENNLKNISLEIPRNQITAVVGVSGSGKSSLVIDILQKESMRQLFDAMGGPNQVKKPMVDSIEGLSPVIYIDQHITNRNPRSTVGTATDILRDIRLLFAQAGVRECSHCGNKIPPLTSEYENAFDGSDGETDSTEMVKDSCPVCGQEIRKFRMSDFSYNHPNGACPKCHGIGQIHSVNRSVAIDEELSVYDGALKSWGKSELKHYVPEVLAAGEYYGFCFDPGEKIRNLSPQAKAFLYYGNEDPRFTKYYPGVEKPKEGNCLFAGFINDMEIKYEKYLDNEDWTGRFGGFMTRAECPECRGSRMSKDLKAVKVNGVSLNELMLYSLQEVQNWIADYREYSKNRMEYRLLGEVVEGIAGRLDELIGLGLGYLSLSRSIVSLSHGEHQRLRVANILGSNLTEMIYIFDEPSIGLHPSDNARILNAIDVLKKKGNTVIIIEHDVELIRKADYIVEIGPEAGTGGGQLLFAGPMEELLQSEASIMRNYVLKKHKIPEETGFSQEDCIKNSIKIKNARKHNLKNISVNIALNKINVITGVSGSGKSSLVFDVLVEAWENHEKKGVRDENIEGYEKLDHVIYMSQKPLSRGARSNIATYTDIYTDIRRLFEKQPGAKMLSLEKRDFSFNVSGGRCERCEGQGTVELNMVLMPAMLIPCPVCKGKRFQKKVLEVEYRGRNITDILNTTCDDALPLFQDVPGIYRVLQAMSEIGLGYLTIGHPLNQLSGGECQRIRLVRELAQNKKGRNLYVLDEPTTGLHPKDIEKLVAMMKNLKQKGHTLVVIEHNLDLICEADHIIDLGTGGGEEGGKVVYQGSVGGLLREPESLTGRCVREYLSQDRQDTRRGEGILPGTKFHGIGLCRPKEAGIAPLAGMGSRDQKRD